MSHIIQGLRYLKHDTRLDIHGPEFQFCRLEDEFGIGILLGLDDLVDFLIRIPGGLKHAPPDFNAVAQRIVLELGQNLRSRHALGIDNHGGIGDGINPGIGLGAGGDS